MKKILALPLLIALATPALADPAQMRAPLAAASLHQGTLDMVAFYAPVGDSFEVTATFAPRSAAFRPSRVVMTLADGDQTSFGIPGHPGSLFHFAREGNFVTVEHVTPGNLAVAAR